MDSEKENKKQLESFFKQEYNTMRGYINSRVKASTEVDAEDIIQDVAVKLFALADNNRIGNVAGFVYRSIRNKIIDISRKNRDTVATSEEYYFESRSLFNEIDNAYSDRMQHELKQAIMSLKPHYRDIIIAIDIEGYTYEEISSEIGTPPGTLMSRRHRAVAQLHKELERKRELNH